MAIAWPLMAWGCVFLISPRFSEFFLVKTPTKNSRKLISVTCHLPVWKTTPSSNALPCNACPYSSWQYRKNVRSQHIRSEQQFANSRVQFANSRLKFANSKVQLANSRMHVANCVLSPFSPMPRSGQQHFSIKVVDCPFFSQCIMAMDARGWGCKNPLLQQFHYSLMIYLTMLGSCSWQFDPS